MFSHFLTGDTLIWVPDNSQSDETNPKSRWSFYRTWKSGLLWAGKESTLPIYLAQMSKRKFAADNIQKDDIVLFLDDMAHLSCNRSTCKTCAWARRSCQDKKKPSLRDQSQKSRYCFYIRTDPLIEWDDISAQQILEPLLEKSLKLLLLLKKKSSAATFEKIL